VHGITTEIARQNGAALKTVLAAITRHIEQASVLVAHNMEFDEKILRC
jgi:DNA polymerase III alpha subunit (gram-positive type)